MCDADVRDALCSPLISSTWRHCHLTRQPHDVISVDCMYKTEIGPTDFHFIHTMLRNTGKLVVVMWYFSKVVISNLFQKAVESTASYNTVLSGENPFVLTYLSVLKTGR